MRTNVQMLTAMQTQLAQMGLVGPKQAYETFKMGCEALGFPNPEKFAMDPASPEYAQHQQQMAQMQQNQPPAPAVQVAKIRAQTEQQVAQSDQQRDVLKLQGQLTQAKAQMAADQAKAQAELAHAALQNHQDREVSLDSNHLQMAQTLIKAYAQILAQKAKIDADADKELVADVRAGQQGIQ
jgi:hypothetical protein